MGDAADDAFDHWLRRTHGISFFQDERKRWPKRKSMTGPKEVIQQHLLKGANNMITHLGVHTVAVQFYNEASGILSARTYHYLTHDDTIKHGDYCVVISPIRGNRPALVRVEAVFHNTRISTAYKWIVDKVDMDEHLRREREEVEEAARIYRLESTRKDLERRLAARKEEIRLEIIRERTQTDVEVQQLEREMSNLNDMINNPPVRIG